MKECEVRENCRNYLMGKCWGCEDYSLYWPENPKILCKRQVKEREKRKLEKKQKKESNASRIGKRAKKKGYAGEKEVVELLAKYGIKAERIPLSGALKTEKYSCDVVMADGKRIEVKRRKSGLKTIKKWMEEDKNSNYIFFREDGSSEGWIVIMPYLEFVELLQKSWQKDGRHDSLYNL